jgi:hypothetical protein
VRRTLPAVAVHGGSRLLLRGRVLRGHDQVRGGAPPGGVRPPVSHGGATQWRVAPADPDFADAVNWSYSATGESGVRHQPDGLPMWHSTGDLRGLTETTDPPNPQWIHRWILLWITLWISPPLGLGRPEGIKVRQQGLTGNLAWRGSWRTGSPEAWSRTMIGLRGALLGTYKFAVQWLIFR